MNWQPIIAVLAFVVALLVASMRVGRVRAAEAFTEGFLAGAAAYFLLSVVAAVPKILEVSR
jgi:hypothetical protein